MTGLSFARRYWNSLTEAEASGSLASGRGRAGFSFWQRYWASFSGVALPIRPGTATRESAVTAAEPSSPARRQRAISQPEAGWFLLPQLPGLAALRAGDEDGVIAEIVTPDGRAELFVRHYGGTPGQYRAEVVLRDFDTLPAVVSIRFTAAEGEQVLLVPLAAQEIGPAAAQVELPGFDRARKWEISAPIQVNRATVWEEETVVASVRAALNEVTRAAWRQVGDVIGGEMRRVIYQALR